MGYGFNDDKSKHHIDDVKLGATVLTPTTNETYESIFKRLCNEIISLESQGYQVLHIDIREEDATRYLYTRRFYLDRNDVNSEGTRQTVMSSVWVNYVSGYEILNAKTLGYMKTSGNVETVDFASYTVNKPNPNNSAPTASSSSQTLTSKYYGNITIVWIKMN